jgi:hypothetical protein
MELVCQIAYSRTALMHSNGHGPIRMTLDQDVRAASVNGSVAFHDLSDATRLTGGAGILELKYYQTFPPVFQELVAKFSLTAQPISKYRMSVAALGLAQEVTI